MSSVASISLETVPNLWNMELDLPVSTKGVPEIQVALCHESLDHIMPLSRSYHITLYLSL
jgi:hypothetical protein